jgi:chemotaxis protein MotB
MAGSGGAWKVAFADFMTAMMALFLVLWISAQDEQILIATSQYFQSPFKSPMEEHSGVMPFNKSTTSSSSGGDDSSEASKPADENKQIELSFLNSVAADFTRLLNLDQDLDKKPIDVQITSDGLRITLFDRAQKPLFLDDTAEFSKWGEYVIQNLAWMIDRHNFLVTIDGHTRAELLLKDPGYSAWELSTDRANASRRKIVHYAVEPELIERVTGYADTQPLPDEPPTSDSNQRITLSLRLSSDHRKKSGSATTPPNPTDSQP